MVNIYIKLPAGEFPLLFFLSGGEDFMFELTNEELKQLEISSRSQIVILNSSGRGTNFKYNPLAFTELGIAMLSSVLRSSLAIDINRNIMRAFVAMRRYLSSITAPENDINRIDKDIRELKQYIEEVFSDYNDINEDTALQLELINQTLAELATAGKTLAGRSKQQERTKIGYEK